MQAANSVSDFTFHVKNSHLQKYSTKEHRHAETFADARIFLKSETHVRFTVTTNQFHISWSLFIVFICYHWSELPQVPFLSQQKFFRDKTDLLSPQKYACRDKNFAATKKRRRKKRRVFSDKSVLA